MKRTVLSLLGLLVGLAVYHLAPEEDRRRQEAPRPVPREAPAAVFSAGAGWSDTDPAINLEHVFAGQVNRRGKPAGFHSRPGGRDPEGARFVRYLARPNGVGVYIAQVEIRGGSGRWLEKRSTFYPDSLSRGEVVAAILHAWRERREMGGGKFQGPSGEGFTIEGYALADGGINTAYPLYRR